MRGLVVGLVAAAALAGCGGNDQFAEANRLMNKHVADDVTLTVQKESQTRHEHADGTYSVCGMVRLQQPPDTDRVERFMVNVRDGNGSGFFDGSSDPDSRAQYQRAWDRLCSPGSENETLIPREAEAPPPRTP